MSARPKTAIAEAFAAKGYRTPRERLDEIGDAVIATEGGLTMDDARREVYAMIGNDQALLWELFTPWHDKAADLVLEGAKMRRSAAKKLSETKPHATRSSTSPSPQSGTRFSVSTVLSPSQRPSGLTSGGATTLRDLEAARGAVATISALNRVHINGQPIGQIRVEEARRWRSTNLRHCRFIELLTANMPPSFIIGEHVKPDEADAFYAQAVKETADV